MHANLKTDFCFVFSTQTNLCIPKMSEIGKEKIFPIQKSRGNPLRNVPENHTFAYNSKSNRFRKESHLVTQIEFGKPLQLRPERTQSGHYLSRKTRFKNYDFKIFQESCRTRQDEQNYFYAFLSYGPYFSRKSKENVKMGSTRLRDTLL